MTFIGLVLVEGQKGRPACKKTQLQQSLNVIFWETRHNVE